MPDKKINVSLEFNANTTNAKKQIYDLQKSLSEVAVTKFGGNMSTDLEKASQVAIKLKSIMNEVTNPKTGKVNFGELEVALKRNQLSIEQIRNSFAKAGHEGTQAFKQFAVTLQNSEVGLMKLQGGLQKLSQTFMNTIRWQITSSITQGIGSALTSVVSYAKDLNKSLNDIRIVTGKSTDEMAQFATAANSAAKNLGTTTQEYLKATQIYFRQGLNTKEVNERTKTTIKFANITGQSAQQASEYLTAIWNNFDDGSKSLENYADALAKLGANTATSADEISQALNKFSAVASTVGLSYESAAAAVATVSAETRQSAEVIGTSFKTLFSRMEQLKLGETLDDGTTLGQYSAALEKVGVSIKDNVGQLKSQDEIIEDTMKVWQTLSKDQQVALAQSVAGIRQYNQFIALMNNSDVYKRDLKLVKESNGELEKQNKIYKEGIEASIDKIKTNLEKIKRDFIGENSLNPILKITEKLTNFLEKIIKSAGGLPSLIGLISTALLRLNKEAAVNSLGKMATGAVVAFGFATGKTKKNRQEAIDKTNKGAANAIYDDNANTTPSSGEISNEFLQRRLKYYEILNKYGDQLSKTQKEEIQMNIQMLDLEEKRALAIAEQAQAAEEAAEQKKKELEDLKTEIADSGDEYMMAASDLISQGGDAETEIRKVQKTNLNKNGAVHAGRTNTFMTRIRNINEDATNILGAIDEDDEGIPGAEEKKKDLEEILELYNKIEAQYKELTDLQKNPDASQADKDRLRKEMGATSQQYMDKVSSVDLISTATDVAVAGKAPGKKEKGKTKSKGTGNEVKNIENVTKAREKNTKAIDSQDKTQKKLQKTQTNGEKLSKKDIKQLKDQGKAQQDLIDLKDESIDVNKELEKTVENYQKGTDDLTNSFKEGVKGENSFANGLVDLSTGIIAGLTGFNMVNSALDSLSDKMADGTAGIGDYIAAFSSAFMGMVQFGSGIKQTIDGIKEIKDAMSAAKKAREILTAAENAGANASIVNSGKEVGAETTKFAAYMATAKAKIASLFSNPITIPFAIAAIAAIAGLGIHFGAKAFAAPKKAAKQKEEEQQAADSAFEEASKKSEEHESDYKDYNKLYNAYQQTGEGREELNDSISKLLDTYDLESEKVKLLTGDYEGLNEAITKARTAELQQTAATAKSARGSNSSNLRKSFRGNKDDNAYEFNYKEGDGKLDFRVAADVGESWADEAKVLDAYNEIKSDSKYAEYAGYLRKDSNRITVTTLNGYNPDDEITTAEELSNVYRAAQVLYELAAKKGADPSKSEVMKELGKFLTSRKDAYDKDQKYASSGYKAEIQGKIGTTFGGNKPTSFKKYREQKNSILKGAEGQRAEEYKLELETNEITAAMDQYSQAYEKQSGILKNSDVKKQLEDLYEYADPVKLKALAGVEVESADGIEDIKNKMEELIETMGEANLEDVAGKYKISTEAAGAFANVLKQENKELEKNASLLYQVSANLITFNGEMDKMADAWKDNKDKILKGSFGTIDFEEGVANVNKQMKVLFNTNADLSNIIRNNGQTIDSMMQGNIDAYNQIQQLVLANIAATSDYSSDLTKIYENINLGAYKAGEEILSPGALDAINKALASEDERRKYEIKEFIESMGLSVDYDDKGLVKKLVQSRDMRKVSDSVFDKNDGDASKKEKKRLEDIIELNHTILLQLEGLKRGYDQLSEAMERAYGQNKLKLMDKMTSSLNLQVKAAKENLNITKRLTELKMGEAQAKGFTFDNWGRINNAEKVIERLVNQFNANKSEENETKLKEAEDALKEYENYYNEWLEAKDEISDLQYQMQDLAIQKIQYKVELKIDMTSDDQAYIDFLMQKLEDDDFAAAEKIELYGRQTQNTLANIQAYEQGIKDVEAALKAGSISQKDAVDSLREYRDAIIEANADLLEFSKTIHEALNTAFDASVEKVEKNISKLDHYSTTLENYKNIIDIVGKANYGISDATMRELNEARLSNSKDKLRATRAEQQMIYNQLERDRKAYEQAVADGREDDIKYWEEAIETAEEKAFEMDETVQELFADTLQMAKDNFSEVIDSIVEQFSEAVSGIYKNLDELQEQWDKSQEIAERFLATYEQTYEVNKLNRKIQQDIEKSNSIGTQKQLRSLQQEMLNMTKDGQKLSKYDLEYLQKKYDLMVAEQAFKDAQNAKSVVRLQRDSEGNYGYVYTADQNNVNAAQQKLEDARYAMEKYGAETVNTLQQQLIQANKAYQEALQAIRDDNTLSLKEQEEKIKQTEEYYEEQIEYLINEAQKMTDRGAELNKEFNTQMATGFKDTIMGSMYPDLQSWEQYYVLVHNNMTTTTDSFIGALRMYEKDIEDIHEDAGESYTGFKDTVKRELGEAQKESERTAKSVEDMASTMDEELRKGTGYVIDFEKIYSSKMADVRISTDQTITKVNELIKQLGAMKTKAEDANKANLAAIASKEKLEGNSGGNVDGNTTTSKVAPTSGTGYFMGTKDGKVHLNSQANGQGIDYGYFNVNTDDLKYAKAAHGTYKMTFSNGTATRVKSKSYHMDVVKDDYASFNSNYINIYSNNFKTGNKNNGELKDGRLIKTINGTTYVSTIDNHDRWYELKYYTQDQTRGNVQYYIKKGQQRYKLSYYDTGGYTGSWGPEGRLAMLHQKEIVLNAHDTENFLAAIGIVRDISDQIEKNALVMQYQSGLANYQAAIKTRDNILQQEVTIHAEFPNATNHSEIEEAFRNLTNYAAQYIHR